MARKPKYEIVKDDLIEKINSGHYAPESQLPSENQLIDIYKVSRVTIRHAIDELYLADYVEKRQGKRTYVRGSRKPQELSKISSYTEEIIRQGMTPSRKLISSQLRLATEEEQTRLQLDKADAVYSLKRIIYADGLPLCYTDTSLPYKFFRDIEKINFEENSLYKIIEDKYKIEISSSSLKLRAVGANSVVSKYLDIEKHSPVLLSTAITNGIVNDELLPIEYFKTYYLTDVFEYTLYQNGR